MGRISKYKVNRVYCKTNQFEMGFGLNLGIPDPRQWKKQQVSKAVIDEERGLTYISKKFNNITYCMVKLHEWEARYEEKTQMFSARGDTAMRRLSRRLSIAPTLSAPTATSAAPTPVNVTNQLLNDHWPLEGKKFEKRAEKLKESSDSFPLRLLLVTQEDMDGTFTSPIKVHGHARIMKVAGKQHEHFLDQLIVKKEQRKQGFGRLLFHMVQCYMQDVYETDRLTTSATPETEMFFKKMEMKKVKDPIAYIDVQESTLYSKVNGILGLNKDSMKRKGDETKLWMAKEMIDMKMIGTPQFRRKEEQKKEEAKKQEEFFESRKAKSNYEAVQVNKDLRLRGSNFESIREKAEQGFEQATFAVPQINITVD